MFLDLKRATARVLYIYHSFKNRQANVQAWAFPMYTLLYTEDQVVMAAHMEGASYMTRKLREEYTDSDLEINLEKQSI